MKDMIAPCALCGKEVRVLLGDRMSQVYCSGCAAIGSDTDRMSLRIFNLEKRLQEEVERHTITVQELWKLRQRIQTLEGKS